MGRDGCGGASGLSRGTGLRRSPCSRQGTIQTLPNCGARGNTLSTTSVGGLLDRTYGDLLGQPVYPWIASEAAPIIRRAAAKHITRRSAQGRSVDPEIMRIAGMSAERLDALIRLRAQRCMGYR